MNAPIDSGEFVAALDALDLEHVRILVAADPTLVHQAIPAEVSKSTTALHRIIPSDGDALRDDQVAMVKLLLDAGAEIDAVGWGANNGVCTPLTMAAWGGHAPLVRLLLSRGADPEGASPPPARRHRPIDTAAAHGHRDSVEALIESGASFDISHIVQSGLIKRLTPLLNADPEAANRPLLDGSRPLHLATSSELMTTLTAADAEIDAVDAHGQTPLHVAIANDRADVARSLIANGATVDIFAAAGLGDSACVAALLDLDPGQALASLTDGVTPLFFAAGAGDVSSCELLLAAGTEVSPRGKRFWASLTPLHLALQRRHLAVVRRLLENGADTNVFDDSAGEYWPTPLHAAARWCDLETVRQLLDFGADPNGGEETDLELGSTGLAWPVFVGDTKTIRLLLEYGLDLSRPVHRNAIATAEARGHKAVVALLRSPDRSQN